MEEVKKMLTIDALKDYGANVEEGLARCFNNESFYLRLVGMGLADANFDRLKENIQSGNAEAAFEAAHALKGALGNLSLTPIYDPICELTERLRGQSAVPDVGDLMKVVLEQREKALELGK